MERSLTKRNAYEVDWENDDHLIDYFVTKWRDRYDYMGGRYRRWYETIACYEGFYYYDYDIALRDFTTKTDLPQWRSRLLINLLLPRIRTLVSKQVKNRPIPDVLPATGDTRDIDIAAGNKKIAQGLWYENNWNYQFVQMLYSLALTGQGYIYVHWNPNTGPLYKVTPEEFVDERILQQVQSEEQLSAYLQDVQAKFLQFIKTNGGDEINLGNIEWTCPTPFDILYPDIYSFKEKPWLILAQIRPISYYAALGYDTTNMSKATEKDRRFVNFTQRLNTLARFDSSIGFTNLEADEESVLELVCWKAADPSLKRGWHTVIAGGSEVLVKGPNPYNHNEIPIVKFSGEQTPGKTISFSAAEQITPQIREYQRTRNKIIEIRNLMAAPKWLVSHTAKLDEAAIDSEPGEVIRFKGPIPPVQVPATPIPAYMFDLQAADIRDMDEIIGQHDSTKGVNAPGVRSAAQGIHLSEMDESQLSIQGLDFETGMSIAFRFTLSTTHQYMPGERLVRYTGEKNKYEIVTIAPQNMVGQNSDIPGADYFFCRCTLTSQYGLSRYGQLAFLEKFLQYGVWGPEDRASILKFIGMGEFENEIDKYKKDRSNADKENKLLMQGQVLHTEQAQMLQQQGADIQLVMREALKPNYTDHHPTHLEEHIQFANNDDFKSLPLQIQQFFLMHIQLTEVEVAKMVMKPQVLAMKAQLELLQEQGLPPEFIQLLGANNGGQTGQRQSSGKPSGRGSANRNTNPGGPRK